MQYLKLVKIYKALESTTKRLEKTKIISDFLKECPNEDLQEVMLLLQGIVFPNWDDRKIGMSSQLILKVIARSTGESPEKIEREWKKIGDLGLIAEDLIKTKKQRTLAFNELTIRKVFENIRKLAELEGSGTVDKKVALISELLSNSKPEEAKFVVRTILEEMRIGVAAGVLRDAIAQAYDIPTEDIEKALNLLDDFGEIAVAAKKGIKALQEIELEPGRPIRVMLAIVVKDVNEGFEYLGKPLQVEYKLDGFRLEIHKKKNIISLFTRRMEDVTKQFPDVVEFVKKNVKGDSFILDSEAVGFDKKTKKYMAFQSISQRIKRKYDIEKTAKDFPVELNIFDIVYYNEKSWKEKPLVERRKLLEKIVKQEKGKIILTKKLVTADEQEAIDFYKQAIKNGLEGVMLKNLNAEYKAGRYVNYMCKLKPVLEPLDLVIIGAEYGTGKRAGGLSSFVLGCKSGNKFLACGMMGTGIKEKVSEEGVTFTELTKILKPYIISEDGKSVKIKPKIVVEVEYEEIQASPSYESGYALRFPRFKRLRIKEKTEKDANTLEDLKRIYKIQKGRR
ncbi:MAG: ATP-dependent DNA ligase [Candidatus Nanoarchaeia archaeon]|nr:ATP-dependent DNA ligase [Candidatus Nanoarchaeia archaeon]MDD5588084.1 ATP-dependent DNA ligase [Candidatus Nanoarchaeia archaeon]